MSETLKDLSFVCYIEGRVRVRVTIRVRATAQKDVSVIRGQEIVPGDVGPGSCSKGAANGGEPAGVDRRGPGEDERDAVVRQVLQAAHLLPNPPLIF